MEGGPTDPAVAAPDPGLQSVVASGELPAILSGENIVACAESEKSVDEGDSTSDSLAPPGSLATPSGESFLGACGKLVKGETTDLVVAAPASGLQSVVALSCVLPEKSVPPCDQKLGNRPTFSDPSGTGTDKAPLVSDIQKPDLKPRQTCERKVPCTTEELQASVLSLKASKDKLERLRQRRRSTMHTMKKLAERPRDRDVPKHILVAIAAAKASVERAEAPLAEMQWYVTKRYKYDSLVDPHTAGSPDEVGHTRYEADRRTVEWADTCIGKLDDMRAEANECKTREKVLLDIHVRTLADEVANKGCARKRLAAIEKLEKYEGLHLAVTSAKASHRQAEAQAENFRGESGEMQENEAFSRELLEETEREYSVVSERYQEECAVLLQIRREAALARRNAKRCKLETP